MFEKLKTAAKSNISQDINVFTCTIGRKATQAKYFLGDSYQIVNVLDQINEVQEKINNGFFKLEKNPNKNKRLNSIANFNSNFKFKGLGEFNFNQEIVKTRVGGDFSRQSGKGKFKFGNMLNNKLKMQEEKIESKINQRLENTNKRFDSANSNKKGQMYKKKSGIADKIANKLGSDGSSYQEFTSQDGKRDN